MGASSALAGIGLAGCRRPEMHLVPFTKSAEWSIPGKFLFYTTSHALAAGECPADRRHLRGPPHEAGGEPLSPDQ